MKILVDGKLVEGNDVKIVVDVNPVNGITEDDSYLEISLTEEGIIADLWEVTDRCTGSSCELTGTFGNMYDEFVELLK